MPLSVGTCCILGYTVGVPSCGDTMLLGTLLLLLLDGRVIPVSAAVGALLAAPSSSLPLPMLQVQQTSTADRSSVLAQQAPNSQVGSLASYQSQPSPKRSFQLLGVSTHSVLLVLLLVGPMLGDDVSVSVVGDGVSVVEDGRGDVDGRMVLLGGGVSDGVGSTVGVLVGTMVGPMLGIPLFLFVGPMLGIPLFLFVGPMLGLPLFGMLGCTVGLTLTLATLLATLGTKLGTLLATLATLGALLVLPPPQTQQAILAVNPVTSSAQQSPKSVQRLLVAYQSHPSSKRSVQLLGVSSHSFVDVVGRTLGDGEGILGFAVGVAVAILAVGVSVGVICFEVVGAADGASTVSKSTQT